MYRKSPRNKMIDLFIALKAFLINAAVVINREKIMNHMTGYFAGAIIAILLLGYLTYTLLKPEKF